MICLGSDMMCPVYWRGMICPWHDLPEFGHDVSGFARGHSCPEEEKGMICPEFGHDVPGVFVGHDLPR